MKAIQLLVNKHLPDDLKDYARSYDAKSVGNLMAEIARRYPEQYVDIAKVLSDIGRHASYKQGETLTLNDMLPVIDRDAQLAVMDKEVEAARKQTKDPAEFKRRRMEIWSRNAADMEKSTQKAALAAGNNLAYSVVSGARGKPAQLKAMITTPGLYTDYKGDPVQLFVRHSFAEGLRPAEYLAGTFGARQSVLSTKRATAKGGDLSKQLVQVAAPLVVTSHDCGANNGIDLSTEDSSLRGRVLVRPAAGLPAGTVLDKAGVAKIRSDKLKSVLVRSAMTCQAAQGVCAKCIGAGPTGQLPRKGAAVGITAAQAIGEPITQAGLNAKHQGGMAGVKKEYSGFHVINQIVQTPEIFPDRATVAKQDGTVQKVEEAPQGGHYIDVDGESHYVPHGYDVLVKPGQKVEAGDQLSDGLVDAGDITELRGLGEGRRYYADRLKKVLEDSGMPTDRRNAEVLARAAINHVTITDPDGLGDYLPDDTANYNRLAATYTPPANAKLSDPQKVIGQFMHAPALHYSIGTRITPKIASHLTDNQFQVVAAPEAPAFAPEMVRLRGAAHDTGDWMASLHTSYLKAQLADSAARGHDTNIQENVHFAPRLAVGAGFGSNIEQTGKF